MAASELFSTGLFNDANLKQYNRFEGDSVATIGANGTDTSMAYGSIYGLFNQGANFGGSSVIKLGNPAALQITGALTLCAWVKTSASAVTRGMIGRMGNTFPNYAYALRMDTGSAIAQFGVSGLGSDFESVNGTTTINDGAWHLVVGTYTPSTNIKVYVDGQLQNTNTTSIPASLYNPSGIIVTIGSTYDVNLNEPWIGNIDDAFIFNRALTLAEIKMLYQGGIAFNAAANSGDVAAASSYSGSASWYGDNRALAIDVSMLGAGVTVTAMTYGGAACTLVGVKSTVTSFGRVEQWRILSSDAGAPAAGANTLVVTLSGSLEFAVEWVSYTGVHQTSPTEGFNSAQATNAGSADNATVNITTVADNDWVHAAVVANDTSITAGNTTRNNIAGTLGSGANEDNGAPKTPAGSVTMSYSGMGITTTWAIAGYALRDINASTIVVASTGGIFMTTNTKFFGS